MRVNPRNQSTINELISKTAGNTKWLELDNDGDLRYKVAISQVRHGEGYNLFNNTVLSITNPNLKLYSVHFLSFPITPVQFVLLVSHKCSHTDKYQIKVEKSCFKKTSNNSKDQFSKRKLLVNGIDS